MFVFESSLSLNVRDGLYYERDFLAWGTSLLLTCRVIISMSTAHVERIKDRSERRVNLSLTVCASAWTCGQ